MRLSIASAIVVTLLTASVTNCVPRKASSTKSIIGDDDRRQVTDSYRNATVGTLHVGDGSAVCTAFASSDDEVMTAAHCLVAGFTDDTYVFRTKTHGARKLNRLVRGGVKSDVAVFKAAESKPEFLPVASQAPSSAEARLIGFDFKSQALLETTKGAINIASVNTGIYRHSFDTLPGQSGSPIIQNGKVVAVHIGSIASRHTNLAVGLAGLDAADVYKSYPDYSPENPAGAIIRQIGKRVIIDAVVGAIVGEIVKDGYDSTKGLISKYIENFRDRLKKDAEDRAFRERALDRDNPGNLSPGGWTGPDFNRGADSHGTAIALTTTVGAGDDLIGEMKIYLAGALSLIYIKANDRDPTADELRTMGQHIRNGASYGFLKATVFNRLPINERHGNNGTVSCDTFCAERRFTDAPGSCVSAKVSTTGRGVHCSEVPGFVEGGELTCNCLGDGFNKPGNNGTVSCRDFCWGEEWGATGNCLAAYKGDSISCDTASGSPQDCTCGGFKQ